jgi:hypothetical protein
MRVLLTAVAFCALSFLCGLAGDLASAPAAPVASVRIALPPPLPVLRTAAAEAAPPAVKLIAPPTHVEKARPLKSAPQKQRAAKTLRKRELAQAFERSLKASA